MDVAIVGGGPSGAWAARTLAGVMADLVARCQPYRTLRTRLLRTFELGLAWKLLRARRSARAHFVR